MKNKWQIILICLASMFLFSGCWSAEEPKHLAIINSILYDVKDNGKYRVVIEFLNPIAAGGTKDNASGGMSPNLTIQSESDNVRVALAQISASMEKRVYASHNKVRFFTDKLVNSGIVGILDYISRDHLTMETALMVVIKANEPEKVYAAHLGLSDTVGDYIEHLSKYQQQSISQSVFITTLDFIKDYYTEGKEPVMGLAELMEHEQIATSDAVVGGEDKNLKIEYEGLAAFKGDRLAGYMNGEEARAYNFLTNNIGTSYIYVAHDYGTSVLEITKSKAELKPVMEGESVAFHVSLYITAGLVVGQGAIDVTNPEVLVSIEEAFSREIINQVGNCILKAQQEFGSDIFGFGNYTHMKYPQKWKEIKDNWNDYFSKAQINIIVESTIDRTGEIKEPIEMEDLA